MPRPDLTDRVVLVTGASRGLGRALALAFVEAGARVALCARSEAPLQEVVAAVEERGGAALAAALDVTDVRALERFVAEAERRWGAVSALVNNASVLDPRRPLARVDLEDWRRALEVNLTGALAAIQAVLPGMRRSGEGSVVNVTSGVGNEARAGWGGYAVSKAALEALTWNLAEEERDSGIRANAVDPGRMRTEMRSEAYPDEDPATVPRPESAVGVFLWLASPASASVTGRRFRAQEWEPPSAR